MRKHMLPVAAALSLAACSGGGLNDLLPRKSIDYKNETQAERSLEVPPDLTADRISNRIGIGGTNYSEFAARKGGPDKRYAGDVLPQIDKVNLMRDGDARWLRVDAPAEVVWTTVLDFWNDQGILIAEQDAVTGTLVTGWLENRAQIGNDVVTRTLRQFVDGLYDTGERDAYRVRLERVSPQQTDVFLTNYGMSEQFGEDNTIERDRIVWVKKPRDPGLEAEMMRRMMVYFGISDEQARAKLLAKDIGAQRSQLLRGDQGVRLVISQPFDRAWRLTGLALDRVGFAVEDRDRAKGIFYVRYNDPTLGQDGDKGFLDGLAFWKDDKKFDVANTYQVRVASGINSAEVTVTDENGGDAGDTGTRILGLLHEEIR